MTEAGNITLSIMYSMLHTSIPYRRLRAALNHNVNTSHLTTRLARRQTRISSLTLAALSRL